jgi:glycosyltransferase involved in cell wall biosynthesis
VSTLQHQGWLNRAFYPTSDWGDQEPAKDDSLFDYLENPEADLILILGFDWHSQPLHSTEKWQSRWLECPAIKIAIINEMCSSPVIQSCPRWYAEMTLALKNASNCVDGIICNHEPDLDFIVNLLNIDKPILFQPFAIDPLIFNDDLNFSRRKAQAFFRGKVNTYYTSNSYTERQLLIQELSHLDLACLESFEENLSLSQYVDELRSYQILLNLPSLSPTLTARVFEAMGCGGLLLQNQVKGAESNRFFKDWEHLVFYDPSNTNDLIEKIKYLLKNPNLCKKISQQGYYLCHQQHTLKSRIEEILVWASSAFEKASLSPASLEVQNLKSEILGNGILGEIKKPFPRIVIDGIFFQLQNTGIARVWQSLLEEWVISGFARHLVVLDRNYTAPQIRGIEYRHIDAYDYERIGIDAQRLQFICNEVKADLFISTYYTTPLSTPSIFIAHDMIPEVMGADLNEPMWRQKRQGILHASGYLAISHNTAQDLVHFFPFISPDSVRVVHNGLSTKKFFQANIQEVLDFRAKYTIEKPYFLFIGSRYSLKAYKNCRLLFKALYQWDDKHKFSLLCVGGKEQLEPELVELSSGLDVQILALDDEELRCAYSGAVALVYPSLYEGFGLPILEAMACSCPVITCPNSAIPEVAGEAVIYVDGYDPQILKQALMQVQDMEVRQALIAQGLARVKQFSWTKTARELASYLEEYAENFQNQPPSKMSLVWQEFYKNQAQLQKLATLVHGFAPQEDVDRLQPAVASEELSMQLVSKQQELEQAQQELSHLQNSKIWRLRTAWFNLKKIFIPLISFVVGFNILLWVNFHNLMGDGGKLLESMQKDFFLRTAVELMALALILGLLGNLGFLSSRLLRLIRIILLGGGAIFLGLFYVF